jgi:hypothetical protein
MSERQSNSQLHGADAGSAPSTPTKRQQDLVERKMGYRRMGHGSERRFIPVHQSGYRPRRTSSHEQGYP